MLNRVLAMGRLTRDPELSTTPSGAKKAVFSMAVDRNYKDRATGERGTDWLDVTAWRQTAEFAAQYLAKGRMVVVEGRLQTSSYTDREGIKRKSVVIVADSIYFADSRRAEGNAPQPAPPARQEYAELDDDNGELPF